MLEQFKTQQTDENKTGDDANTIGLGIMSTDTTDADSPTGDDATKDMTPHMEASPQPTIELDEVFGLLKNRRRRDVLRHLSENDDQMRLGELAEQIAARECEKDVSQINSQERKRVYVGLYQCHLPKLADTGVIKYNKPRGTIERGPTFDHITRYLPPEETPVDGPSRNHSLRESLSKLVPSGSRFL